MQSSFDRFYIFFSYYRATSYRLKSSFFCCGVYRQYIQRKHNTALLNNESLYKDVKDTMLCEVKSQRQLFLPVCAP